MAMAVCLSIHACSRTAISLDGRAGSDGKRIQTQRPPSSDAGTPLLDAGHVKPPIPDAGVAPEVFRVTVYDRDRPQEGVDIVFHSPDGRFEHFARTPSNGTIERKIQTGSMMTILVPAGSDDDELGDQAFTYTDLRVGQHIHAGKREAIPPSGSDQMQFLLQNKPDQLDRVSIDVGCGRGRGEVWDSTSASLEVDRECLSNNGKLNAFIRGGAERGGEPWFAFLTDFEMRRNGENEAAISNWTQGNGQFSIRMNEVPEEAEAIYLGVELKRGGRRFEANAAYEETRRGNGLVSVRFPLGFAESIYFRAAIVFATRDNYGDYYVNERAAVADETVVSLNAESDFLGRIRDVEASSSGRSGRPVVTWRQQESRISADALFVRLRLAAGFSNLRWTAIIRSNQSSAFEFPEIPPEIGGFGQFSRAEIEAKQVISLESSLIDGFTDLQENFGLSAFELSDREQVETKYALGGNFEFD
jgi:hypothetical protein